VDHTYLLYVQEGAPGGLLVHARSIYSSVSSVRDIEGESGDSPPLPVPSSVRNRPLTWELAPSGVRLARFRTRTWSLTHFVSTRPVDLGIVERTEARAGSLTFRNGTPLSLSGLDLRGAKGHFRFRGAIPPGGERRIPVSGPGLRGSAEAGPIDLAEEDFRRALRAWPEPDSDYEVTGVADFDPSELPPQVLLRPAEGSRGYLVLLGRAGGRR